MNNKVVLPEEFTPYLFDFYYDVSVWIGAGTSGWAYATTFTGGSNCDYLSPVLVFNGVSRSHECEYCNYGLNITDNYGKLYGDGCGCPLEGAYCNPYKLPITFRLTHQESAVLKSWSRRL